MEIHQFVKDIKDEIGKVIIGNENTVELILNALINEGHILLESVPGTGKTTLAKSIARTIDGDFNRIQFTPDVLPSDVTGIHFSIQKISNLNCASDLLSQTFCLLTKSIVQHRERNQVC